MNYVEFFSLPRWLSEENVFYPWKSSSNVSFPKCSQSLMQEAANEASSGPHSLPLVPPLHSDQYKELSPNHKNSQQWLVISSLSLDDSLLLFAHIQILSPDNR